MYLEPPPPSQKEGNKRRMKEKTVELNWNHYVCLGNLLSDQAIYCFIGFLNSRRKKRVRILSSEGVQCALAMTMAKSDLDRIYLLLHH